MKPVKQLTDATVFFFFCAALAFGFSQYALGVWLGFGSVTCLALILTASMRADHPQTVEELVRIAGRLDAQREMLVTIEARLQNVQLALTSQNLGQARPSGPLRSPVRPPVTR